MAVIPVLAALVFLVLAFADEESPIPDTSSPDEYYSTDSTGDTTFMELHLSPEGVYAVDSAGNEWEYDFSRESFVSEDDTGEVSTTVTIFGRDEVGQVLSEEIGRLRDDLDDMELEELEARAEAIARAAEEASIKRYKGLQLRAVTVEIGEFVDGPIVAIGPVTVKGTVEGDVISYKRVTITSTGVIIGDVRAPEIVKMRGGIIEGNRIETDLPSPPRIEIFDKSDDAALIVNIIIFVSLLLCSLLAVAVVPRPVDRVKICLETSFLKSFFVGFGGWFALGPLFGILVLTIVGIPVAVFVLPIALVVGVILGIIGASQLVGQISGRYIGGRYDTQLKRVLVGLTILYLSWILMSVFMAMPSGAARFFDILFLVVSIILWSIVVSAGLGAVVLTRFGSRDCKRIREHEIQIQVATTPSKPPPPSPPPLKKDEDGTDNQS